MRQGGLRTAALGADGCGLYLRRLWPGLFWIHTVRPQRSCAQPALPRFSRYLKSQLQKCCLFNGIIACCPWRAGRYPSRGQAAHKA